MEKEAPFPAAFAKTQSAFVGTWDTSRIVFLGKRARFETDEVRPG
jgi:hypothetical protein